MNRMAEVQHRQDMRDMVLRSQSGAAPKEEDLLSFTCARAVPQYVVPGCDWVRFAMLSHSSQRSEGKGPTA